MLHERATRVLRASLDFRQMLGGLLNLTPVLHQSTSNPLRLPSVIPYLGRPWFSTSVEDDEDLLKALTEEEDFTDETF